MEAWIPITLAAAFFQNLRSALQKHLQAGLSTLGSSYARFVFAAPFATIYCLGIAWAEGAALPQPNWVFAGWGAMGGLMQISATVLLLAAFRHRSFAVATAYSKTETAQVALVGLAHIAQIIPHFKLHQRDVRLEVAKAALNPVNMPPPAVVAILLDFIKGISRMQMRHLIKQPVHIVDNRLIIEQLQKKRIFGQ